MSQIARLSILSNALYIKKAGAFLISLLEEYPLQAEDVMNLRIALEEALSKTVSSSMEAGELRFVDVVFFDTGQTIEVSVTNNGIPYEIPPAVQNETAPDLPPADDPDALSDYIMKKAADDVFYRNKGFGGQEICLVRNMEAPDQPMPEKLKAGLPEAEGPADLSFRDIRPDEVLEITRLIYDEYKYTYVSEDVYYPEKIVEQIDSAQLFSHVAITDTGEVAAHAALKCLPACPRLMDTSMWVVKQKFRNQKIMRALLPWSLDKAKSLDLNGIIVEAVTHHPATQKVSLRHGFHATGFLLLYTPGTTKVNYRSGVGRRCLGLGYRPEKNIPQVSLYAPEAHQAFILERYRRIGTAVDFQRPDGAPAAAGDSLLQTCRNNYRIVAEIDIVCCGADLKAVLKSEVRRLKIDSIQVVLLRIPMEDPLCPQIYETALQNGFFFTGVIPHTGNGNFLLMQNLMGNAVDYDSLICVDEYADTLDYIRMFDPDEIAGAASAPLP